MPVRSLTSSVLRWPEREQVLAAAREYARTLLDADPRVVRVGVFGSYAVRDEGPGSDLDLLVEMSETPLIPSERAPGLPRPSPPVPVDLVVMTCEEVAARREASPRWDRAVFRRMICLAAR